jgi:hypothetical protein
LLTAAAMIMRRQKRVAVNYLYNPGAALFNHAQ